MPVRELIPAAQIARRVAEMGAEIDARLPPGPLTVVGVLRGAFVFMADLVRAIPREVVFATAPGVILSADSVDLPAHSAAVIQAG